MRVCELRWDERRRRWWRVKGGKFYLFKTSESHTVKVLVFFLYLFFVWRHWKTVSRKVIREGIRRKSQSSFFSRFWHPSIKGWCLMLENLNLHKKRLKIIDRRKAHERKRGFESEWREIEQKKSFFLLLSFFVLLFEVEMLKVSQNEKPFILFICVNVCVYFKCL